MTQEELIEACRSWTPHGLCHFYQWIYAELGWTMPDHLMPVALGVCDTRINKLMLVIGPGSGKSQLLSIVVPAWILGHNPDMTILGISGGEALMQGFQEAVQDIIDKSSVWKQVFPMVRPDKVRGWSSTGGMYVTGKRPGIPDASYLAAGVDSKYLTGKHAKLLIIDDIHNEENSSTAEQCEKVVQKYAKTVVGRADPMGARFIMAGRRWHEDDIYGKLRYSDWVVMQLPAERPGAKNLYYDIWVPTDAEGRPANCVFTDKKCLLPTGELVDV